MSNDLYLCHQKFVYLTIACIRLFERWTRKSHPSKLFECGKWFVKSYLPKEEEWLPLLILKCLIGFRINFHILNLGDIEHFVRNLANIYLIYLLRFQGLKIEQINEFFFAIIIIQILKKITSKSGKGETEKCQWES